jgi:hypothetical protein
MLNKYFYLKILVAHDTLVINETILFAGESFQPHKATRIQENPGIVLSQILLEVVCYFCGLP